MKKICLGFAMMLAVLFAFPTVKTEAAEGILKNYYSGVQYLAYSKNVNAKLYCPWDYGDRVTFKNLTPKNLTIVSTGYEAATSAYAELKMKKNTTGKIKVTLKTGGKTYSKTVSVKWYTRPTMKKFSVGGKSYLSKLKKTDFYLELLDYLTGKVSVTAPSGWTVDSQMTVWYRRDDGQLVHTRMSFTKKLPARTAYVGITLTNKSNPELRHSYGVGTCFRYETLISE